MAFQLRNFLVLKTLKTFYLDYYKVLIYYIANSLKNYLDDTINIFHNTLEVKYLFDLLIFKTTNLTSSVVDTVQDFNPKILIYLPLKIKNLKNNVSKLIYYLIGELPKYTFDKNLIINGLKKTFISKLDINTTGIFFNSFLKNNETVFYAKVIFNTKITFNIVLENTGCFILSNKFKYNIISFLYLVGFSVKDILTYSRYNQCFYLKKLLLEAKCNSSHTNNIHLQSIFSFFNTFFKSNMCFVGTQNYKKNTFYLTNNYLNIITLLAIDFIAVFDILLDIKYGKRTFVELDHFSQRSVSTLGTYFSLHFSKFMVTSISALKKDLNTILHTSLDLIFKESDIYFKSKEYFNLKEYLTVTPLVQYLEQINSFSEIAHKNRVTNYNSKMQQNLQIRNINLNQIGSLCLLDTTEGINCGLVISFTKYVNLLKKNNIKFPYSFSIDVKTKEFVKFINSFNQETYFVLFNNYYLRKNKIFQFFNLGLSKGSFKLKNINISNSIYIKPNNLFSFAENLIPFLFYNDPARGLMGAKMQTQSVPVIKSKKSFIITGYEKDVLNSTNTLLKTFQEGIVTYVSSFKIIIRDIYNRKIVYYLQKYKRSNHNTIIHQKPTVWVGERVFCGQLLTSTQDILGSEFTVGNTLLVCYGNFLGYNFEDAIVINKKVVYSQLFTSLHFNVYDVIFSILNKDTFEVPTINLPNKSYVYKRNLDSFGIIKEGSKVLNNDILVSKVCVSKLSFSTLPIFNLIYILFGQEIRNIKDKSIVTSFGNSGRIVRTEIFSVPHKISTSMGFYLKCRIYVCNQRLLSVGDKLCGRHGNKGIVAYIGSNNDLPYSTSLTPDIMTDALGIPSRMNIGQLFESLFGLGCYFKNTRMCLTNTFNLPKNYTKLLLYKYLKQLKSKTGNT